MAAARSTKRRTWPSSKILSSTAENLMHVLIIAVGLFVLGCDPPRSGFEPSTELGLDATETDATPLDAGTDIGPDAAEADVFLDAGAGQLDASESDGALLDAGADQPVLDCREDGVCTPNGCLEGPVDCHPDAVCLNTRTGYDCACRSGFEGDGTACEPRPAGGFSQLALNANMVCGLRDGVAHCFDTLGHFTVQPQSRWRSLVGGLVISGVRTDGTGWLWAGSRAPQPFGDAPALRWQAVHYPYGIAEDGTLWRWWQDALEMVDDRPGWTGLHSDGSRGCAVVDATPHCLDPGDVAPIPFGPPSEGPIRVWVRRPSGTCFEQNGIISCRNGTLPERPFGPEHDIRTLALGQNHTCGIDADHRLWCRDDNRFGQVGVTPRDGQVEPERLSGEWTAVAAERDRTCAIRADSTLWCWGRGLVLRAERQALIPVLFGRIDDIALASTQACVRRTQEVWCLGKPETTGGVGDGTRLPRASLVRVGAEQNWQSIKISQTSTCGIDDADHLWCWGRFGESPDGERVGRLPARMLPEQAWQAVAFGRLPHVPGGFTPMCALGADGTLWCDNDQVSSLTLEQRGEFDDWRHLTWFFQQICGIRGAGELWCSNIDGAFERIDPLDGWATLSWRGNRLFALRDDGQLYSGRPDEPFAPVGDARWLSHDGLVGVRTDGTAWHDGQLLPGTEWQQVVESDGVICGVRRDELVCSGDFVSRWAQGEGVGHRPVPLTLP
jgi:hypothetical protein